MKDYGLSDVLGPIMIGPSSSHTAGALRIAAMVRKLLTAEPVEVRFTLYGSFARTYRGHGTDRALVAGILGFGTDDLRIRDSLDLAGQMGLSYDFVIDTHKKTSHPNTVDVLVRDAAGQAIEARGESIGGGAARLTRIDGNPVELAGEHNSVIVYQHDVPGVLGFIAGTFGAHAINIGSVRLYRSRPGGEAFNVLEVDGPISQEVQDEILAFSEVRRLLFMPAMGGQAVAPAPDDPAPAFSAGEAELRLRDMEFLDGASILSFAEDHDMNLGQVFLLREELRQAMHGVGRAQVDAYLDRVAQVMADSVRGALTQRTQTMGGLIGGEAHALTSSAAGDPVFDNVSARAAAYSMAALETNASMGRIVAAPTAGSCGVLPGVMMALEDQVGFGVQERREALGCAAAIGYVVSRNATVAGAEGGCQAEMGTAAAMAAGAATQLMGGTARQCLTAAAITITNMLGLVCDPVGGLVEDPCQKRNASGAANALVAAQMALAGVPSTAPFDESVDAMRRVGRSLPMELRETALGGIAACPSCRARLKLRL